MPDISMCLGDGCLKKATCHRFTAKPSPYRQAYFLPTPNKDDKCEYYWDDKNHKDEDSRL